MPFILTFVVESFITLGAGKSIHTRVFRFMILFRLNCFEHLTTIITRIPFTLMTPHVQLKIVTIIVPLPANATEMRVFPCVVLIVSIQRIFATKYFITLVASPYFRLCIQAVPESVLLQKFFGLFGFLLSRLHIQNKRGFN